MMKIQSKLYTGIGYAFPLIIMAFIVSLLSSLSYAGTDSPFDAEGGLTITPDKQYRFAEQYFSSDEHSRAIGEYQRFIFFFPNDVRVEQAMHRIGMAFYRDGHFVEAVKAFEKLIDRFKDTDLSIESYLMISECYVKLDRAGSAVGNLHNLITVTDKIDVKDEASYRIGWIYLEAASWEKARAYFEKISIKNRGKYNLNELFTGLSKKDALEKKDPALTGFLSIVTGAG